MAKIKNKFKECKEFLGLSENDRISKYVDIEKDEITLEYSVFKKLEKDKLRAELELESALKMIDELEMELRHGKN